MNLLLIRHAIAADRFDGTSDELRPLTEEGKKKMQRAARGLRAAVPSIELLATSPLVRAVATGAIVEAAYADLRIRPAVREIEELRPGTESDELLAWLDKQSADPIALVGHEPDLSELLARLVGAERPFHRFRKGGAACIAFPGRVEAGAGTLSWALPPGLLRDLGSGKKAGTR
ncbi:MAG TPA: phosphohistidine phosphatase SixA [Thermoanaerobaculia bacterium]|jgi:phosphohistidine phosphatase|nr:phosphohistidine phosphatase SixA [Thermoanaerobaculia bacterium]